MDEANKAIIRKLGGLTPLLTLISGGKVNPNDKFKISDEDRREAMGDVEEEEPKVDKQKIRDLLSDVPDQEANNDPDSANLQVDGTERSKSAIYGEWGPETDMEKGNFQNFTYLQFKVPLLLVLPSST